MCGGVRNSVVERNKVEETHIRLSFQKNKDEVICERFGQRGRVGTGDAGTVENAWNREAM